MAWHFRAQAVSILCHSMRRGALLTHRHESMHCKIRISNIFIWYSWWKGFIYHSVITSLLTLDFELVGGSHTNMLPSWQYRLDKVRDLRWETGGAIIPTRLQRKLSAKESEFFASYDKILSDYMGNYPLLDLTGSTLVSFWKIFAWKKRYI